MTEDTDGERETATGATQGLHVAVADLTFRPPARANGFIGTGRLSDVAERFGVHGLHVSFVEFEPGARTAPHAHSEDQILYFVSGRGRYAVDGGADQEVAAGQFVFLPRNVAHMHGAADGEPATHVSIMLASTVYARFDDLPAAWRHLEA